MMRRRIGVLRQRRNVKAADIEDVDYIAKIESVPGAFGTIRPPRILQAACSKLIDSRRQAAIFLGATTTSKREIHMSKTLLSREELRARAFEAIRQCDGCGAVSDVMIYEINDDSSHSNWGIGAIGVDPGSATAATRAAVYVQQELQEEFDLLSAL